MKTQRSRHIIDSTKNLPLLVRIRDIILTILVWLLYLYFMRDFFAFIADVFDWSVHGFSHAEAYHTFQIMDTIVSYIEIIVVMEVLFVAWSFYNLLRFGKKTRRKSPIAVTTEDIAKKYSLNTQDVEKWQKARSMVMHHDKRGHLVEVEIT